MKNNKTLLIVLSLAVVASLVTLAAKSNKYFFGNNGMMSFFGANRFEEMMGVDVNEMMVKNQLVDQDFSEVNSAGFDGELSYEEDVSPISKTSMISEPMMYPGIMPPYYYDDALGVVDRVYQKSSNHSVVVKDVPEYLRGIKEYVLSIGGKILNSGVTSGSGYNDNYNSGSLFMKVPVDKFDEATARITDKVDKVYFESIDANDVTGQLVNTTDNLQMLRDEKSLKEAALLDAKTEVEKRMYKIEIERLEKQIINAEKGVDSVEQTVDYSSISVQASDSERYFNFEARLSLKEEFLRALKSAKDFLKSVAYFGVWVLAYSLVLFPIVWVVKKFFRMFGNKK